MQSSVALSQQGSSLALSAEALKCPICLCILEDACETDCGHAFCHECITQYIGTNSTCPICRADISYVHSSYSLRLLVKLHNQTLNSAACSSSSLSSASQSSTSPSSSLPIPSSSKPSEVPCLTKQFPQYGSCSPPSSSPVSLYPTLPSSSSYSSSSSPSSSSTSSSSYVSSGVVIPTIKSPAPYVYFSLTPSSIAPSVSGAPLPVVNPPMEGEGDAGTSPLLPSGQSQSGGNRRAKIGLANLLAGDDWRLSWTAGWGLVVAFGFLLVVLWNTWAPECPLQVYFAAMVLAGNVAGPLLLILGILQKQDKLDAKPLRERWYFPAVKEFILFGCFTALIPTAMVGCFVGPMCLWLDQSVDTCANNCDQLQTGVLLFINILTWVSCLELAAWSLPLWWLYWVGSAIFRTCRWLSRLHKEKKKQQMVEQQAEQGSINV